MYPSNVYTSKSMTHCDDTTNNRYKVESDKGSLLVIDNFDPRTVGAAHVGLN